MKRLVVFTGPPGSGKSTVLQHLADLNCHVVSEPAREIIAEQRSIGGRGVYDRDPQLFVDLMLSRSLYLFKTHQQDERSQSVFFDRGIPDTVAYAQIFGLDAAAELRAAQLYRYHQRVFFFPSWNKIYCTDDERTLTFQQAKEFGDKMREVYLSLGYEIIEVPMVSVEERAAFIEIHFQ